MSKVQLVLMTRRIFPNPSGGSQEKDLKKQPYIFWAENTMLPVKLETGWKGVQAGVSERPFDKRV